ncbi:hypothetical protein QNI16_06400 [Cytophagaceae bacterium YF14B1]|uniref:Uncharacterized protein n=1 Tax=Xanthocytophaga flava TaxID=3048013 RepID=A0AAE3QMF5_9BACT|nr:hypothetical protein [Xanthocytophaga flavus]MDJ1480110.1 hypothetical protein [Xanthocytophaga flavus]
MRNNLTMPIKLVLDWLLQKPIQWKVLRKALINKGYAIYDPYIVYKGCRVGRFSVNPVTEAVTIYTHSKHRGYCHSYVVRDLEIALHKIRRSYKNFIYASEQPGAAVREIKIPVKSNSRLLQTQ